MTKYRSLLIFGPPGSGKGTLGNFLKIVGGHFHLSTGDVYRNLPPEAESTKELKSYMDKGLLASDELAVQIWHEYVERQIQIGNYDPSRQLLLLDGIPRTPNQVGLIAPYATVEKIISLEISNEAELVQRLSKRAKEQGREDDSKEEVIRQRFKVYKQKTVEVLGCYPQELFFKVDAQQSRVEVLRDVLVALAPLLQNEVPH